MQGFKSMFRYFEFTFTGTVVSLYLLSIFFLNSVCNEINL